MLIAIATQSGTLLAEDAGSSSWNLDSKRESEELEHTAVSTELKMGWLPGLVSRKEDGPCGGSWFLHISAG